MVGRMRYVSKVRSLTTRLYSIAAVYTRRWRRWQEESGTILAGADAVPTTLLTTPQQTAHMRSRAPCAGESMVSRRPRPLNVACRLSGFLAHKLRRVISHVVGPARGGRASAGRRRRTPDR